MTRATGAWWLTTADIVPGATPRWYRCRRCHMRSRRLRFVLRGRQTCEWCKARRQAERWQGGAACPGLAQS